MGAIPFSGQWWQMDAAEGSYPTNSPAGGPEAQRWNAEQEGFVAGQNDGEGSFYIALVIAS